MRRPYKIKGQSLFLKKSQTLHLFHAETSGLWFSASLLLSGPHQTDCEVCRLKSQHCFEKTYEHKLLRHIYTCGPNCECKCWMNNMMLLWSLVFGSVLLLSSFIVTLAWIGEQMCLFRILNSNFSHYLPCNAFHLFIYVFTQCVVFFLVFFFCSYRSRTFVDGS